MATFCTMKVAPKLEATSSRERGNSSRKIARKVGLLPVAPLPNFLSKFLKRSGTCQALSKGNCDGRKCRLRKSIRHQEERVVFFVPFISRCVVPMIGKCKALMCSNRVASCLFWLRLLFVRTTRTKQDFTVFIIALAPGTPSTEWSWEAENSFTEKVWYHCKWNSMHSISSPAPWWGLECEWSEGWKITMVHLPSSSFTNTEKGVTRF